ncbi:MAG: PTS glucitol/sorbitol transporter subunit IIA [Coriobacteriia bacterium]|nr:PTS glucitol/sorbitol transporter subunit IIA [Coriobacteriia bacterium]
MSKLFSTEVTKMGPEAQRSLDKKMVILFGSYTPAELKNYCFNISGGTIEGTIEPGMKVVFDDQEYEITLVGSEAQNTLQSIGHCCFKFTGKTEDGMPGTIHLEDKPAPKIEVGTKIEIID